MNTAQQERRQPLHGHVPRAPANFHDVKIKLLRKGEKLQMSIRDTVLNMLVDSQGLPDKVRAGVKWSFSQIKANNAYQDSILVAECISIWVEAYPGSGGVVLQALEQDANSYLDGAGEGIATGLLQIANCGEDPEYECRMFDAFDPGHIFSVMSYSKKTPGGADGLAGAISRFTSNMWADTDCARRRRTLLLRMLTSWRQIFRRDGCEEITPLMTPYLVPTKPGTDNFLAHFAQELSDRFKIRGSLGLNLDFVEIIGKGLKGEYFDEEILKAQTLRKFFSSGTGGANEA